MQIFPVNSSLDRYWRFGTVLVTAICFMLCSLKCSDSERYKNVTSGTVTVYTDESLYKVVKETADSFMVAYPNSKLTVVSVKSREGIAKILNGEASIFISARKLNDEEAEFKKNHQVEFKTIKYVFDGVTVVTRTDDPLQYISFDSLKLFLTGQNTSYNVFVPEKNSGITEFLHYQVLHGTDSIKVNKTLDEAEVIKSVEKTKKSIGFIGWNNYLPTGQLKILMIGPEKQQSAKKVYFEPHPGYFVQKLYPLTRECVILLSEVRLGLASGFATYLTANPGQRIALQSNLGPATVPVRLVQ